MPAFLALLAAMSWGLADFLGGAASRRMPTSLVLFWSQLTGLVLIGLVLLAGQWQAPGAYLWWGAGAGAASAAATACFYKALAEGTMSVVAPIAGTGLLVPVVVGLVSGERPSAVQVAGIVLAALGVVLASGPELRGGAGSSVGYAVLAACGFGVTLALIPYGGEGRWAMTTAALGVVSVTLIFLSILVRPPDAPGFAGENPAPVLAIGALNVAALGLYTISSGRGLVSVVSVLASLYPVVTVVLAQVLFGERLRGVQLGGVAAAFAGVVCLGAG